MPIQSTTEYRNGNVKNVVGLSFGQIYTLDIHTGVHIFNLFASGVHAHLQINLTMKFEKYLQRGSVKPN